jgi:hypothetical protein
VNVILNLAALPDLASMQRVNALKGRPFDQVGSVTTASRLPVRTPDVRTYAA